MKKGLLLSLLMVFSISGCATKDNNLIKVYTRDSASGAREAFSSIIKLENMSDEAAETTSNGDMARQVGSTENGIGYVSLTTDLNANGLKALSYDGVDASIETVYSGAYNLARPFSYVTRESGDFDSERKEKLVLAFIDYLTLSTEGLEMVLSAGGIVDVKQGIPWSDLALNHPVVDEYNGDIIIRTGGSTSVTQTLDTVMASFIPMAGNFKYEPNHTGSSDGYKRSLGSEKNSVNQIDIGFASREFKESEDTSNSLKSGVYCLDAVLVVVNEKNVALRDADADLLRQIFSGEKKSW